MGNETFLAFTTSHLPVAEQNLARYRLQIVEPPRLPLEKKPHADRDGPEVEPNLWMWVNPKIVYPPGKLEAQGTSEKELAGAVPRPWLPCHQEDACCPEAAGPVHCRLPPPSSLHRQSTFRLPPGPPPEPEASASQQPGGEALALAPLNYFHLIALALRNSSPRGLNMQQIYSFTRQHFPVFRMAPEGWKNTICHNLCFRDSFEKVPVSMQVAAITPSRSCFWKLTEEGRHRFAEEACALAVTQLESIQQCMNQPDMMLFLFDL
uniref:Fork-head domain-containing protein n=1 Tax=Oryctolagus cuniculus TaxID=9986 RepID=G1TFE1_RABIT